jgi:superfamily II DNA/RNA helicase
MIGQSQSGTGKMVAFVLTMLNRIDFSKNKTQVRGMILVARLAILDVDPLTRPSV